MPTINKITLLAMALLLAVGAASCGSKTPVGPVILHVLIMDQVGMSQDDLKSVAQEFTASNPDIQVELTFLPEQQVHDGFAAGMAAYPPTYDVVLTDPTWLDEWIKMGYLADDTKRVTADLHQNIFSSAWGSVTRKAKIYGMPWMPDTQFLYYNRNLLAQAGFSDPPKTWEDLIDMAKAIKAKGLVQYPLVWSWKGADDLTGDFTTLLYDHGGKFLDDKGNPVFNDAKGVAVLTWMKQTLDDGLSDPASLTDLKGDVQASFSSGAAAFVLDWLSMYDPVQFDRTRSQITGKVGITTVPVFKDVAGTLPSASVNGMRSLGIAGSSKNIAAAWKYVVYLASFDVQMKYAAKQMPVWATAYQDGNLNVLRATSRSSPVVAPIFAEQFQQAVPPPTIPFYTDGSNALQLAMQQALTGQKTPQEALDAAAGTWIQLASKK